MVVQAQLADAQGITDLVNSDTKHLVSRTLAEVQENIHEFVVIKDGDKVIACGAFDEYAPKIAEIRSIIVDPHYRGRGYAEQIVAELVKRGKPGQQVFVVTSNSKFFKKVGFHHELNEKQFLFIQLPKPAPFRHPREGGEPEQ